MRTPNLGTVLYAAGDPSGIQNLPDLIRFLREEGLKQQAAISALARGHYDKVHVAPPKPRDGDIAYADGSDWDPGGGQGVYIFEEPAAVWVQLG